MADFDLIITAFNSGLEDFKHRCSNLLRSLETIPKNVKVILVEQDWLNLPTFIEETRKSWPRDVVSYHLKLNKPFNKSWLYNYAVKNLSSSDRLIFGETDVLFPEGYFSAFDEFLQRTGYEWCLGWDRILYLDDKSKITPMSNLSLKPMNNGGGCWGMALYITRPLFEDIGGYNEYIQGAAVVDNDIAARLIFKTHQVNNFEMPLTHLFHERNSSPVCWGSRWRETYSNAIFHPDKNISILKTVYKDAGSEIPLLYSAPGLVKF